MHCWRLIAHYSVHFAVVQQRHECDFEVAVQHVSRSQHCADAHLSFPLVRQKSLADDRFAADVPLCDWRREHT